MVRLRRPTLKRETCRSKAGAPRTLSHSGKKAAALDPGNAQAHFVMARALRELGRTEEAEKEMKLFETLGSSTSGVARKPVP